MGNPDEVENTVRIGGDNNGTTIQAGRDVNQFRPDVRVLYAALAVTVIALIAVLAFALLIAKNDSPATATTPTADPAPPLTTQPRSTTTPTTPTTTPPTTTPTSTTATEPATEPTPLPPTRYERVYSAERALHHTNIDTTPPRRDNSPQASYSVDFVPPVGAMTPRGELYAGSMYSVPTGSVAEWTAPHRPDGPACADLADRAGNGRVRITEHASYCLLTRRGTVAFLESVHFTDDAAVATVTVWARR